MRSESWPRARLWSRRVRQVMFSGGMEGAFCCRMSALVFAGLATTTTWQPSQCGESTPLECAKSCGLPFRTNHFIKCGLEIRCP